MRIRASLLVGVLAGLQVMAVTGFATLAGAQPQDATKPPGAAAIAQTKAALDEIEQALSRDDITAEALAALRQKLNDTADALRATIDDIEPRANEAEERLKQLGPPPGKDAAPETAEIAAERAELTARFGELDGTLKEARVLSVRSDQLSERIAQMRHALYARELFARSASVLDPFFWSEAARALPLELVRAQALIDNWRTQRADPARLAAALLGFLLILAVTIALSRWWFPRLGAAPADTGAAKAWTALAVFAWLAARTPAASLAALSVADTLGLLTPRLEQIAQGLIAGLAAAAFGHGVARGLFAVERPARRLIAEDDATARTFHNHLLWASRVLGVAIPLQVLHKTLFAPLIITIATNALFAAVVAAFLIHLGVPVGAAQGPRRRRPHRRDLDPPARPPPGGADRAGAHRGLYRLCRLSRAARDCRGRRVRGALSAHRRHAHAVRRHRRGQRARPQARGEPGAQPAQPRHRRRPALGRHPRPAHRARLPPDHRSLGSLHRRPLRYRPQRAVRLQDRRAAPLAARTHQRRVALALVLIITRLAQRWLESELLPRTALEPSLQLSILTIFGYLGAITAIALALLSLGFDLQKIALIAGALSVGIGFGLQSIVSNFVSGLILLTERPIRVGDAIVVKGEEGWVRRVRVRATEIETYDRASVIIPNSEFITGVVKNWTRTDRLGRIVIKVTASYASDPARVRDILVEIARAHAQVMAAPAPAAFLVGFGDNALEFELRCVVADREQGLAVRSDLNCAIIKRFREAAIEIPYPQRELRWRGEKPHDGGEVRRRARRSDQASGSGLVRPLKQLVDRNLG